MATKAVKPTKATEVFSEQHGKDIAKLEKAAKRGDIVVFLYNKAESESAALLEMRVVRLEHIREAESSHKDYIHGFDLLREDFRNFRLERIWPGSVKVAR